MMHATFDELEAFVSAQLPVERSAWLEAHCEACDDCAAALAGEARLEVTLRSMAADRRCGTDARAVVVPPFVSEPVRHRAPGFYALAAAACVLLAFAAARLPHVTAVEHRPVEVYADAGDLARAASSAVPVWAAGSPSGGTP